MKPQTTLTKVLSALALAGILSICTATIAQAGPQPHLKTGMFGLARGQVARINAANIGDPNQIGDRPIEVEMLFLDSTGAVVGRDVKTIAPGQAVFFDLAFDAGVEKNRIELRAVINAIPPPEPIRTSGSPWRSSTPSRARPPCSSAIPAYEAKGAMRRKSEATSTK